MENTPPLPQIESVSSAPEPMSLTGRLMNVLAAPGEVFDYVSATGITLSNWLAPALIFIVVNWLAGALLFSQPHIQQQIKDMAGQRLDKQFEKMNLPPEKADTVRDQAERTSAIVLRVMQFAGPPASVFTTTFVWALVLWLVAKVAFKSGTEYMKLAEVTGLAAMVSVLETIVRTLLAVAMGNLFASPSLGLLVKNFDAQIPTHAVLASVDIMTFWLLTVVAIGFSRVVRVSFAKAAGCVFGIWIVYKAVIIGVTAIVRAAFGT